MKNAVGLFETMRDAAAVVHELRDAGIHNTDISFAARSPDATIMEANPPAAEGHSEAAEGATGGAVVGGLAGLLVGLGTITTPGIGPMIAAGALGAGLESAALGAGAGSATGGLVGVLVGAGIPEEDAHIYSDGVRRGGALVMAQVDDRMVPTALGIMERHNVVDIDERGAAYRASGWLHFDANESRYFRPDSTSSELRYDEYDRDSGIDTSGRAAGGIARGTDPIDDVDEVIRNYFDPGNVGAGGGSVGGGVVDLDVGSAGGLGGGVVGGSRTTDDDRSTTSELFRDIFGRDTLHPSPFTGGDPSRFGQAEDVEHPGNSDTDDRDTIIPPIRVDRSRNFFGPDAAFGEHPGDSDTDDR